jgi:hypothetical protein
MSILLASQSRYAVYEGVQLGGVHVQVYLTGPASH